MKKHSRTFFVKQIPHKYEMFQQINNKSLRTTWILLPCQKPAHQI